MIDKTLPGFCYSKRSLENIGGIIIHYFSAINAEPAMPFDMEVCRDLFLDLNRPKSQREHYLRDGPDERMYASAHVLIGRDGEEWKLVPFGRQAYHAGESILHGRRHCNNFTLGVELVGTIDSGFTESQYVKTAGFCYTMMKAHGFGLHEIAGHDQVRYAAIQAGLTRDRKYDPSGRYDGTGNNFDWGHLHGHIKAFASADEP